MELRSIVIGLAFATTACGSPPGQSPAQDTAGEVGPDSGMVTPGTASPAGSEPTAMGADGPPESVAEGMPAPAPDGAMDSAGFVQQMASGDMYETQSSRLALQRSKDPKIREFAQQMITDHGATTKRLSAIAQGQNLTMPVQPLPKHSAMLADLRKLSGGDAAAFDKLYMDQQRTAHAEAVDLLRSTSNRGDYSASLREFATETLPVVEGHLQHLE